jgi:hypothetical protein
MRKALVVLAAIAAVTGLWAQEQKQEQKSETPVIRVYQVNPGSVGRIRDALSNIGIMQTSAQSDVFIVRTSPQMAPAVDEIVNKLNTAARPKNIELTFYILQGTREPAAETGTIPADLQPVINQLKTVFTYKDFRLLDTAFVRSRSGEQANMSGVAAYGKEGGPYQLVLRPSVSSEAKPATIRIDSLRFNIRVVRISGTSQYSQDLGFNAEIDFKEGQKAVIGKTGIEGEQSALILVATGKVVE